ncbi:hypothetical protein T06_7175, partial [Trichinella sp. T6]
LPIASVSRTQTWRSWAWQRAAGSASDAATVVNDAAPVNDAADNASAVPGEDKPRTAGSRPTSTARSRLSSRGVLKSS